MTLKLSTDVQAPRCADKFCSFGVIEGIGAAIAAGVASAGVGAAAAGVIGTVGSYAVVGAGVGALTAAVTGGKVLKGAGYGALAGLGVGAGAAIAGVGYEGGLGALVGGGSEAAGAGAAAAGSGAEAAPAAAGATAEQIASEIPGGLAASSGEAAGALSSAAPIASTGTAGGALAQAAPEVANMVAPTIANAAPAAAPTLAQIGTPSILSGADTVAAAPTGIAGAAGPSGLAAYGGASPGFLSSLGLTKGDIVRGALAGFGSMMSGGQRPPPGPESTAATRGPYFDMPVKSTGYVNRQLNQQYQPAGGDWYHYGQNPNQPSFYTNNKLDLGYARGGALSTRGRYAPQAPARQARFDSSVGDKYVRGGPNDGGGKDDRVDAKLSPGEWVADANFVSALGDGSNEEGSRRLYAMRKAVMRDKGMTKVVPPKLKKSPMGYLSEVSR